MADFASRKVHFTSAIGMVLNVENLVDSGKPVNVFGITLHNHPTDGSWKGVTIIDGDGNTIAVVFMNASRDDEVISIPFHATNGVGLKATKNQQISGTVYYSQTGS